MMGDRGSNIQGSRWPVSLQQKNNTMTSDVPRLRLVVAVDGAEFIAYS